MTSTLPALSPTNSLSPLFACVPDPPMVKPSSPKLRLDGAVAPVDLLTRIMLTI